MASVKCKVNLKDFVPDLSGYTSVKDGGGVQSMLAGKANAVRSSANSLSDGKHVVVHKRGKYDMYYAVAANDFDARYDQAKNKTLTKALNSLGGS